jgi:hypothetical protein
VVLVVVLAAEVDVLAAEVDRLLVMEVVPAMGAVPLYW